MSPSVPAVSVILPTHNRSATLRRAIDSVLAQTWHDFELIIVDDGSTDGTAQLLDTYADARLRMIHIPQRGGAAKARNEGIRAARANWIAFQDSDDAWLPEKLERQFALRDRHADVGWIGGSYRVRNRLVRSERLVAGRDYDGELLVGEPFVTPTWLVRRQALLDAGLFDESVPCLEDWDLIFRLADRCAFRAVSEPVLVRYASSDSLFGDGIKRRAGLEVVLSRHRERWLREPRRYARWCTEAGRLSALQGDVQRSRRWLLEGLRAYPMQWRATGLLLAGILSEGFARRLCRTRFVASMP